jgi:hypothetical protein
MLNEITESIKGIIMIVMVAFALLNNIINPKEITTPNTIYNVETNKELTKYLAVALNTYDIKKIIIVIRYLTPEEFIYLSTPLGVTKAITQYKEGVYCISLVPTSPEESIRLIAHEIVHVKQLYDKRIIYSDTSFIWKGKEMYSAIPIYDERPWEIEAMTKEDSITNIIKDEINFVD